MASHFDDIEPALPPHAHSETQPRTSKRPSATVAFDVDPAYSYTGWGINPTPPPKKKWHETPFWNKMKSGIPAPIAHRTARIGSWLGGDGESKVNSIVPFFPHIQTFHSRIFAQLPKLARAGILICAFMLWLVLFGVLLSKDSLPSNIGGFGTPIRLSCTARLWCVIGRRVLEFY